MTTPLKLEVVGRAMGKLIKEERERTDRLLADALTPAAITKGLVGQMFTANLKAIQERAEGIVHTRAHVLSGTSAELPKALQKAVSHE